MSWSRQGGRSGPRGYHHGNLKEALIDAALELIAQKGPAGFTFAEAARWAGVSPAAPYRHFRDRDELMFFRDPAGGGGPMLYTVDVTGRNEQLLKTPSYASDPAWSPLLQ